MTASDVRFDAWAFVSVFVCRLVRVLASLTLLTARPGRPLKRRKRRITCGALFGGSSLEDLCRFQTKANGSVVLLIGRSRTAFSDNPHIDDPFVISDFVLSAPPDGTDRPRQAVEIPHCSSARLAQTFRSRVMRKCEDDYPVLVGSIHHRDGKSLTNTRRVFFEAGEPVSGKATARAEASSTERRNGRRARAPGHCSRRLQQGTHAALAQ